ncbi:MAG: MBL fold metallo-hydrolase [Spirochaetia bacterium]
MGYSPPDDITFPKPVDRKMSSKDFMNTIRTSKVPDGHVSIWTLGQNSFLLKDDKGTIIAIDPYLTDFCASGRDGERNAKSRLLPVFIEPEDFFADIILITHSHCDHADPLTLERYTFKEQTGFLAPFQAAKVLKERGVDVGNITVMHPRQEWSHRDMKITAAYCEPTDTSDLNHIGYLVEFGNGKCYYNTGDTAMSSLLQRPGEIQPDLMSICINGGYRNLSHWEAAVVAGRVRPKKAAPSHFDLMPHNVQPPHMFAKSLSINAPDVEYCLLPYYEETCF